MSSTIPTPCSGVRSPPPCRLPPVKPVYAVSAFENLVPKWVAQYKLSGSSVANFRFSPGGSVPHPYAASDVLHVLCGTGQFNALRAADRAAFIEQIQSVQKSDGFFEESDSHGVAGGSMWHAAG